MPIPLLPLQLLSLMVGIQARKLQKSYMQYKNTCLRIWFFMLLDKNYMQKDNQFQMEDDSE
jgi:hypothetical protein